jgi:ABC-type phosphate transport system substrate-binding protein
MRTKRNLPGLLALGVVCVMALFGAVGAGSAMAAEEPGEQCAGASIEGGGSSLQKTAQGIWDGEITDAGKGFNGSTNGSACSGTQGSKGTPKVTKYESVGSGEAKLLWGAETAGNKPLDGKKENPGESKFDYIGTDEPLDAAQLENLDGAAGGTGQAIVIPVEQAAVAVVVNPPAECLITKITNENLQKIWNGEITEWSGVTGGKAEGAGVTEDVSGDCKVEIKRVVRLDSSGTTFVFKLYLSEINNTTCAGGTETWTFYAEPAHNTEWPQASKGTCKGKVTVSAKKGGSGEVEEVKKVSGSIGYANLADAREGFTDEEGNHFHWLGVQNQKEKEFYPLPGTTTGEPSLTSGESNCAGTHYTGATSVKVGADDNWSGVSGAHPGNKAGTENEHYPICTLTYDVALMNYTLASLEPEPTKVAKTVYDYLNYVVAKGGGQADLAGHDYRKVEEAVLTFSREEALLIAEGAAVSFESTPATTFDETENIFLWAPPVGTTKVTIKDVASLPFTPSVTILVTSGTYSLTKNECTKELKTGESCSVEVVKTTAGLAYVMLGAINILHVE